MMILATVLNFFGIVALAFLGKYWLLGYFLIGAGYAMCFIFEHHLHSDELRNALFVWIYWPIDILIRIGWL